jgi:hypothetical protein
MAALSVNDQLSIYAANKSVAQKNYKEVTHNQISTAV